LLSNKYTDTDEQTFDSILKTGMSEKIRALRKALEASGGKNQAQPQAAYGELCNTLKSTANMSDSSKGKKAKASHPIIMISSSPTALITLWNVKKFLEQGM
jgi:parafibromin